MRLEHADCPDFGAAGVCYSVHCPYRHEITGDAEPCAKWAACGSCSRAKLHEDADQERKCAAPATAVVAAGAHAATARAKRGYGFVPDHLLGRVLRQFRVVARRGAKLGVHPEMASDPLEWTVHLTGFNPGSADPNEAALARDLGRCQAADRDHGEPAITLRVRFPPLYPAVAPHVRVVRPQFCFRTGHVTLGGIVCLEKLGRTSAWDPDTKLLPLLLEVKMVMIEGGGRLQIHNGEEYCEHDAREAWERMKRTHGWD